MTDNIPETQNNEITQDSQTRSLSTRLSFWIVGLSAFLLVSALGMMFYTSRTAVMDEAEKGAFRELGNTVLRVNSIIDQVEVAANNMEGFVLKSLDNPDAMYEYARNLVENNPLLIGASISFEPYYYKDKGRYYSIYANRYGDSVRVTQEGNDGYQYFYMDWYLQPKLLGESTWTEPYFDYNPDNFYAEDISSSYCKPLYDKDGRFVGSLSVDISLRWLSEEISKVKPYPRSYSILIGRGGTFLVHPDSTKLLYQTIFTESLVNPDSPLAELGRAMTQGEEGMKVLTLDGWKSHVFYQQLDGTGWGVAVICPDSDIFIGFNHLRRMVISNVIIGLILLFLICGSMIRSQLNPLKTLADQAETIAEGNFDNQLPPIKRMDEIGQLTQSFGHMQSSLVNYINELTQTTAKKERIEGELQIARDIQMGMVPRIFPPFPSRKDVDLYASMTPAKEVGGDLYDFFIQQGKLYYCIGDVSGKGVPASLFMAVARNLFRVVAQQETSPDKIARQINDTLSEDNEQLMFVTMFIGVVDLKTGNMEFCNCGHNPPVILSHNGNKPQFLECESNTPIGVCLGWDFKGQKIDGFKDIPIVFYTDGLNEAENIEHEEFGNDRMLKVLETPYKDASSTVELLRNAVAEHAGEAEPSDDLTIMCLEVKTVKD